jgi:hypothetical protein
MLRLIDTAASQRLHPEGKHIRTKLYHYVRDNSNDINTVINYHYVRDDSNVINTVINYHYVRDIFKSQRLHPKGKHIRTKLYHVVRDNNNDINTVINYHYVRDVKSDSNNDINYHLVRDIKSDNNNHAVRDTKDLRE